MPTCQICNGSDPPDEDNGYRSVPVHALGNGRYSYDANSVELITVCSNCLVDGEVDDEDELDSDLEDEEAEDEDLDDEDEDEDEDEDDEDE